MPSLLFYHFAYEDHLERRTPHRAGHLAHAQAAAERGELLLGGPLNHPMDGAVCVFTTAEAAHAFAGADPYVLAGLVGKWEVREWEAGVGVCVDKV